jgi:acyl dehydratase
MTEPLHFEDLVVGNCWKSLGRTVTETDIVNFAGITGDYSSLHVDHEFARQTPFGKPIAHGLLGLSLVAGLASQCPSVRTIAFLKIENWEFLKPIYVGDTVHAETEVIGKNANGRRTGYVTWRRRLVNQSGDVVQSGVFQTLVSAAQVHRNPTEVPSAAAVVANPHGATKVKRAVG